MCCVQLCHHLCESYHVSIDLCFTVVFFFQAEDGIRDLVRSRGLGDVYKRQIQNIGSVSIQQSNPSVVWVGTGEGNPRNSLNLGAVSYTHLTLPTSDLV